MTEFGENCKSGRASRTASGKKQTVFRNASPTNPYAQIPNTTLRDKDLSMGAGWLLMLCLSMRQDWTASSAQMARMRGMSLNSVKTYLRELEALGYCKRVRTRNNLGKLGGFEFWFSDTKGYFSTNLPTDQNLVDGSTDQNTIDQKTTDGFLTPIRRLVSQEDCQTKKTKTENEFASRTDGALPTAPTIDPRAVFSPSVLRKIEDLGIETAPLIERYFAKTKLKRVKDPSAYLLKMAKQDAQDRDGVPAVVVDALVHGQPAERAKALGAVLRADRVLPDWQRRSATNANRSALTATNLLKGKP